MAQQWLAKAPLKHAASLCRWISDSSDMTYRMLQHLCIVWTNRIAGECDGQFCPSFLSLLWQHPRWCLWTAVFLSPLHWHLGHVCDLLFIWFVIRLCGISVTHGRCIRVIVLAFILPECLSVLPFLLSSQSSLGSYTSNIPLSKFWIQTSNLSLGSLPREEGIAPDFFSFSFWRCSFSALHLLCAGVVTTKIIFCCLCINLQDQ